MKRIFKRGEDNINYGYRDLVLINEEKDIIKFYHQEIKLGFPFSVFIMSLKEAGYTSAKDYYKSITKRQRYNIGKTFIKEIEASSQIALEISGLVKLAYHRIQEGKGYDDALEYMKEYGLSEETIFKKIKLYFENKLERHTIKVFLEDGNTWVTEINGTVDEIISYYLENMWNIRSVEPENFQRCIKVEFID